MEQTMVDQINRQFGIDLKELAQLNDGVLLSSIVNRRLFGGNKPEIETRIKTDNLHQTGTKIVNINMILRQIKRLPECPEHILSITAFNLLEKPESMLKLVEWLTDSTGQQQIQQQQPQQQQEHNDEFNNFYFASEIQNQMAEELYEIPDQQDEIVKPGSIKIFKPKTVTKEVDLPQPYDQPHDKPHEQPHDKPHEQLHNQPHDLPKPYEQPPRFIDKDRIKPKSNSVQDNINNPLLSNRIKQHNSNVNTNHTSNMVNSGQASTHNSKIFEYQEYPNKQNLERELHKIDREIRQEERSLKKAQKTQHKSTTSLEIQVPEVLKSTRKEIVEWLIGINLLNSLAIKNYDNLHNICKNGLIFPEIINYKKGREEELKYERNPKKPTEIHANYKRVFEYFKQFSNFNSDLLFKYDSFVPEVAEKIFWSFLRDIHCFYKNKKVHSSSEKSLPKKVSQASLEVAKDSQSYRKLKLNDADRRSNRKILKLQTESSEDLEQKENRNSMNVQQPLQKLVQPSSGYHRIHMGRRLETPKRDTTNNSNNSSMAKSRVSLNNSAKKPTQQELPSITLEMELVSLKYLKANNYPLKIPKSFQDKELFEDPLRNGTLLMLVVCKHFQCKSDFKIKPKGIDDCRDNFACAFRIIKARMGDTFPDRFYGLGQHIIKGDKNIFYGVIYHMITKESPNNQQDTIVEWIQELTRHSEGLNAMKLKSYQQVVEATSNGLLLNQLAKIYMANSTIKPVHQKPQSVIHNEANLNKILQTMSESKLISNGYIWKAKHIANGDTQIIVNLLNSIRRNQLIHNDTQKPYQPVSFNHLLRHNNYTSLNNTFDFQNKPLETTMSNHMHSNHMHSTNLMYQKQQEEDEISERPNPIPVQQVEIPWMKTIGFSCSHAINNGVILCRLLEKLTMKSIEGVHLLPQTKPEMMLNIRKALKELRACANNKLFDFVDETYILEADDQATRRVYSAIREAYKNSYLFTRKK